MRRSADFLLMIAMLALASSTFADSTQSIKVRISYQNKPVGGASVTLGCVADTLRTNNYGVVSATIKENTKSCSIDLTYQGRKSESVDLPIKGTNTRVHLVLRRSGDIWLLDAR